MATLRGPRGDALIQLERHGEAADAIAAALSIDPSNDYAASSRELLEQMPGISLVENSDPTTTEPVQVAQMREQYCNVVNPAELTEVATTDTITGTSDGQLWYQPSWSQ